MNTLMKRNSSNGSTPATFSGMVDRIFQNNLNRLFDDEFWGFNAFDRTFNVPVNLRETDKSFELEVVAPGYKKEDFKINLHGETLTVSLEHKEEDTHESKDEGWLRKEYKKHSFSRSFQLDDVVDTGRITAVYNDGILHLSLLKKDNAQKVSRNIEIQ